MKKWETEKQAKIFAKKKMKNTFFDRLFSFFFSSFDLCLKHSALLLKKLSRDDDNDASNTKRRRCERVLFDFDEEE